MWIKLISPRSTQRPLDTAWKTRMSPPLALLVLGALTPRRHQVTVEDENVMRLRLRDRPDLVGITVKVDTADRAFTLAAHYHARGIPVVLGGIHVSACPEACQPHADALVVGEAEAVWPSLLEDAENGRLQPRYSRPVAIEEVPVPRWDLLDHSRYMFTNTIRIGRGCPWRCDFCYNSAPGIEARYRVKSLAMVLREIESLGTDHVMFIDDNFIGDKMFVRKLLPELERLGIVWHTAVSADIGQHEDLLDGMAVAGCKSLFIGFETINPDNLRGCSKVQNRIHQYDHTIDCIHERGIMVNASLVFGFDADREDIFSRTLDWLVQRRIATMTAHILTPYPGTVWHRRLEQQNRILDRDLTHYNTAHVVFKPAGMSAAALRRGYLWIYRQFYSWPNLLRRLPLQTCQRTAFLQFNLLYRKYGYITQIIGRIVGMRRLSDLARRLAYPSRYRIKAHYSSTSSTSIRHT